MAAGTKYFSNKQESTIAKALGWSVVPGSGARHLYPGDISGIDWLGECKTHTQPNSPISFNLKVWDKISKEASARCRFPVLFVDDGSQLLTKTWCMIPESIDIAELDPTLPIVNYPKTIKSSVTFEQSLLDSNQIYYCVAAETTMFLMHFNSFVELFKR